MTVNFGKKLSEEINQLNLTSADEGGGDGSTGGDGRIGGIGSRDGSTLAERKMKPSILCVLSVDKHVCTRARTPTHPPHTHTHTHSENEREVGGIDFEWKRQKNEEERKREKENVEVKQKEVS